MYYYYYWSDSSSQNDLPCVTIRSDCPPHDSILQVIHDSRGQSQHLYFYCMCYHLTLIHLVIVKTCVCVCLQMTHSELKRPAG